MSTINIKPEVLSRPRILLVEDNILNQKLVSFMLRGQGFDCEVCSDGKQAIEKLRVSEFDLVLMDIEMPEMNGYEATRSIRRELKLDLPVIALSAHASEDEKEKCIAAGMNDYLMKPFHADQFNEIVNTYLLPRLIEEDAVSDKTD